MAIPVATPKALLADKGYDADHLCDRIEEIGHTNKVRIVLDRFRSGRFVAPGYPARSGGSGASKSWPP